MNRKTGLATTIKQIAAIAIVLAILASMASATMQETERTLKDKYKKFEAPYVPGEVLVKYKGDARWTLEKVSPERTVENAISELKKRPDVEKAEPNYIVSIAAIPNDPKFPEQWGLHNTGQSGGVTDADIDAPEAWNIQKGSKNVIVVVTDTGADCRSPDLIGIVDCSKGRNYYANSSNVSDDNGHGTHVSGIIGARGNNGIGITGVNWNVTIVPIKFLDADGSGTVDEAIASIDYATQFADIISASWGCIGCDSQALADAIARANAKGILFVAAAGNYGSDNDAYPFYPASYPLPNIVSVAATDRHDRMASWSNYGLNSVHLSAPGEEILSTVPRGSCALCNSSGYSYLSGTSMAVPYVSGAAALIVRQYPELRHNVTAIKSKLLRGADPISDLSDRTITGGRLNVYNALENDTVPPAAITDLTATNATIDHIALRWTATGDNGIMGKAKAYDIRYSASPITNANWARATQATGEPRPQISGSQETFIVKKLNFNTTYYFAIKAIDNVGNPSVISNIVSRKTLVPVVVFRDYMENGTNGWTHTGAGDNWQLGKPIFGPGHAYSGLKVWGTNLTTGIYGRDGMNASLISRSFSLKDIISAKLAFQHYFSMEKYWDGGIVQISSDGGNTWVQIVPLDGYPEPNLYYENPLGNVSAYSGYSGPGWHKAIFDLAAYNGKSNLKIRFSFGTDSSENSYPGWYIDNVEIYGSPAPKKCWSGSNQYLVNNKNQAEKFAKCATGIFNYKKEYRIDGHASAYQYLSARNDSNWSVKKRDHVIKPIYAIKGTDGGIYNTNKDYFIK